MLPGRRLGRRYEARPAGAVSVDYNGGMIPAEHRWLFWEVDPAMVDLERHRDYVLERVMARGDWAAMRWLIKTFPCSIVADFLTRRGERLAPRERAFWALIAGLGRVSKPGGGRARWAG